ncbi:MAG: bifunctional DNA-formamidopyrimidine glycosylase/DNA-(apurinic or apyrimidinic site) lyase [Methylococcus sp.]
MPELPEVETTLRGIRPHLQGETIERLIVRDARLRWPIPAALPEQLKGCRIETLRRRGKYILMGLQRSGAGEGGNPDGRDSARASQASFSPQAVSPGGTLIFHLGMSGSLRITEAASPPRKHDHYDLTLPSGLCLRFHDPRRFGCLLWTGDDPGLHPLIAPLGVEPLEEGFDGRLLYDRSRGRSAAVKTLIMDSHVVVGVGNIYASESLFRAGIAPQRAAGRISLDRYRRLAAAIKGVLAASLEQGGTTLRNFVNESGSPGYFKQTLNVYDRAGAPCRVCGQPIQVSRLGQRSTYWCARCQR